TGILVVRLVVIPEGDEVLLIKGNLAIGAQIVLDVSLGIADGQFQGALGHGIVAIIPVVGNRIVGLDGPAAQGGEGQRIVVGGHPIGAGEGADILAVRNGELDVVAVVGAQSRHQRSLTGAVAAFVL